MTDSSVTKRTRCTWTAAERAEWLAMFETSGQTASEFCRDNDLSPATLSFWRTQGTARTRESADVGELVEVPFGAVDAGVAGIAPVTIELPGNVRLSVAPGTDVTWLSDLLRILAPVRG